MTRYRPSRLPLAGVALSTVSIETRCWNTSSLLGRRFAPLLAWISLLSIPSLAGETLDQVYDPTLAGNATISVNRTFQGAQTFTVGLDGMLTRVELYGFTLAQVDEFMTLDIRETTGGAPVPTDDPIAAVQILHSSFPGPSAGWMSVDLRSFGIAVQAGEQLAIVLRYEGTDNTVVYGWRGGTGNPYPGGAFFARMLPAGWQAGTFNTDAGFRTWVDPDFAHPTCFGDGTAAACPCGNSGASGEGCANSTGAGCALTASGSTSIAAGDLVLSATNAVPNKAGMLFQGTGSLQGGAGLAFGDGIRCCGGMVVRLEVVLPDSNGTVSSTIDLAAVGAVAAGDPRCYQLWYRDLPGGPCASTFNLSNALQIIWRL